MWFFWARNSSRVQLGGSSAPHGINWTRENVMHMPGACTDVAGSGKAWRRGPGAGVGGIAFALPVASLGFLTAGPSQSSWTSALAAQALTASATKNQGRSCKAHFHCILLVREAAKRFKGKIIRCYLSVGGRAKNFWPSLTYHRYCIQLLFVKKEVK